jgi:hypothetical protein
MKAGLATLAVGMTLAATPAAACTICHTPTALGVRHLLLEHDLARNIAAIATPIPILLAAIMFAAREPQRRRGVKG